VDGDPLVISASSDGTVRLWDALQGQPRGKLLEGHSGSVNAVALGDVDGVPVVVSGGADNSVRLWNARTCDALNCPPSYSSFGEASFHYLN
jgi:WD40 repeat protein